MSQADDSLVPPNAKPGQCFTRVWNPPKYETVTSRQLVEESSERIEVIPASYKSGTKRILVKEASERIETVPATYKTVTERVMVKPATTRLQQVAAVYGTETTRVLEKPAHTVWKKGTGPIQKIDAQSGEIMCLVEIPASYKTIQKRVLKTPATTKTINIPAEYKTVEKRVVATPATTRKITVPAQYKTISTTEVASAAQERRIKIPARYQDVTSQKLVSEGSMQWREILCETNMTSSRIMGIQKALKAAGYNPGNIDGNIGADTMRAVNAYQRAKGLPVDKYLNMATVRALGA
ncbi:MAG: peptidoglycan-binding domain-containing protein [Pseudomonadota bacterium]